MNCKCGFEFSRTESFKKQQYESFVAISDENYIEFIKREVSVLQAKEEQEKIEAIVDASEYVETILICPKCKRLLLILSNYDKPQFYSYEE